MLTYPVQLVVGLDGRPRDPVHLEQRGPELPGGDLLGLNARFAILPFRLDSLVRAGAYRSHVWPAPLAALVTGGTGRVGSTIAARLAAEGYRVKAAGRRDGDLRSAGAAAELVERTADELGGLDLVVHAASDGFSPVRSPR